MIGRPVLPPLTLLLVGMLAGCSHGQPATRPGTRSPAPHVAPQQTGGPLGAPGCKPASPLNGSRWGIPEVEGTGHGASLWGLLMFPHAMPARVGDQEKIVWQMTGSGPLRLAVIGPGGLRERLAWGPAEHEGSS